MAVAVAVAVDVAVAVAVGVDVAVARSVGVDVRSRLGAGVDVAVAVAVGVDVAVAVAVGVDVGVNVAVAVAVGLAEGVGVGVPGVGDGQVNYGDEAIALIGIIRNQVVVDELKVIWGGCQTSVVLAPHVLLTLSILRLYSTPDPFSGVKSSEKADTRRVLIGPGPGRTFPDTFQLVEVSPAAATGPTVGKLMTVESKMKSPWKPT